ncbi:hypothetical protein GGR52DRAFT_299042 [Hypoxylon sp. FL1284]|nr:hypothetical protein GGR52DRAFT_299042 [Hypoxylon sp. FL1284]
MGVSSSKPAVDALISTCSDESDGPTQTTDLLNTDGSHQSGTRDTSDVDAGGSSPSRFVFSTQSFNDEDSPHATASNGFAQAIASLGSARSVFNSAADPSAATPTLSDAASRFSSTTTLVPDNDFDQDLGQRAPEAEIARRRAASSDRPNNAPSYLHYLTTVPQLHLLVEPCPFAAFASSIIPPPMSSPPRDRAVGFASTRVIIQPDGRTEMEPANVSSSSITEVDETAEATVVDQAPEPNAEAAPTVEAPPPGGPPPNPPTTPAAAAAPEPDDNSHRSPPLGTAAPSAGAHTQNHPPLGPPIGARQRAAMANAGAAFVVVNPYHQPQHSAGVFDPQQPFLWVNAPMVAPSVPPHPPGNTGSWCHPRQSPFWARQPPTPYTSSQPQVYVQEQAYIAQLGYILRHQSNGIYVWYRM